jgi:predicted ribonuclease YlaK
MAVRIFLDTMVYLHFRPLLELPLGKLCGSDDFKIVVPRITLRELDKHKSSHSSRKVRDRARRITNQLQVAITGDGILPGGIEVEYFGKHPRAKIDAHELSEVWADDLLIASILTYKEHCPNCDVLLITQDSGPRLTAHEFGLQTIEMSTDFALPEDLDDVARQNRNLQMQIQELQNARPKLELLFIGADLPHVSRFALAAHRRFPTLNATSSGA